MKSLVVQRVYEGIDLCVGLVWVVGMGKKVYRSLDGSRFLLGGDPKKKKKANHSKTNAFQKIDFLEMKVTFFMSFIMHCLNFTMADDYVYEHSNFTCFTRSLARSLALVLSRNLIDYRDDMDGRISVKV